MFNEHTSKEKTEKTNEIPRVPQVGQRTEPQVLTAKQTTTEQIERLTRNKYRYMIHHLLLAHFDGNTQNQYLN